MIITLSKNVRYNGVSHKVGTEIDVPEVDMEAFEKAQAIATDEEDEIVIEELEDKKAIE